MSRFDGRLEEARALRRAAQRNFHRELDYVRGEVSPQALGARLTRSLGSKLEVAGDEVVSFAGRNPGKLAALGAALACASGFWLARHRIASALSPLFSEGRKYVRSE